MSKVRWSRWSSLAVVTAIAVPVAVVGSVGTSAAPPPVPDLAWQPCGEDFPGASAPWRPCRSTTTTPAPARPRSPSPGTRRPIRRTGSAASSSIRADPAAAVSGSSCRDSVSSSRRARGTVRRRRLRPPRRRRLGSAALLRQRARQLDEFFAPVPGLPVRAATSTARSTTPTRRSGRVPRRRTDHGAHEHRQRGARHGSAPPSRRRPALSYIGFSYGSYLGNTYANLFPRNIRALVIDGVLDPNLWSSGLQIRSDRVATKEEFDEFLRLCDEAGDDCAFSGPEGSAARWAALARRHPREPLEFPDGFVYTYDLLIGDVIGAMYAPEVWGGRKEPPHSSTSSPMPCSATRRRCRAPQPSGCVDRANGSTPPASRPTTTMGSTRTTATSAPTRSTRRRSEASSPSTGTRRPGRSSARSGGGSTPGAPTGRSTRTATPVRGRLAPPRRCSSSATTSMA